MKYHISQWPPHEGQWMRCIAEQGKCPFADAADHKTIPELSKAGGGVINNGVWPNGIQRVSTVSKVEAGGFWIEGPKTVRAYQEDGSKFTRKGLGLWKKLMGVMLLSELRGRRR